MLGNALLLWGIAKQISPSALPTRLRAQFIGLFVNHYRYIGHQGLQIWAYFFPPNLNAYSKRYFPWLEYLLIFYHFLFFLSLPHLKCFNNKLQRRSIIIMLLLYSLSQGSPRPAPRFSDCRRLTAQPVVLIRPMIYYAKGYKAKWAKRKGTWHEVQENPGTSFQE